MKKYIIPILLMYFLSSCSEKNTPKPANVPLWKPINKPISFYAEHGYGYEPEVFFSKDGRTLMTRDNFKEIDTAYEESHALVYTLSENTDWQPFGASEIDSAYFGTGRVFNMSHNGNRLMISDEMGYDSVVTKTFDRTDRGWEAVSFQIGEKLRRLKLSADGSTMVAYSDLNGTNTSQLRVFTYDSGNWVPKGDSIPVQDIEFDIGRSVSWDHVSLNWDGSLLAVGNPYTDVNGTHSGKVTLYKFENGRWSHYGNTLFGSFPYHYFGEKIIFKDSGSELLIRASSRDYNANTKFYIFKDNIWKDDTRYTDIENLTGEIYRYSEDGQTLLTTKTDLKYVYGWPDHVYVYQHANDGWELKAYIDELPGEVQEFEMNDDETLLNILFTEYTKKFILTYRKP